VVEVPRGDSPERIADFEHFPLRPEKGRGRMRSKTGLALAFMASISLAACGTTPGDRAVSGGLLGAGTGAVIGSIAGGAGEGALIGGLGPSPARATSIWVSRRGIGRAHTITITVRQAARQRELPRPQRRFAAETNRIAAMRGNPGQFLPPVREGICTRSLRD
jgi:hypothetical protein